MKQKIAFLHTAKTHVNTFDALVAEFDEDIEAIHFVHEELLSEALDRGLNPKLEKQVQQAMQQASKTAQAKIVVCTCSTIGHAAEKTGPKETFTAMRIDRAMADKAVQLGHNIWIVATAASTLAPTQSLLESSAQRVGKSPTITTTLVPNAWQYFESGNLEIYHQTIANHIMIGWQKYDLIVLAQASMEQAITYTKDVRISILSSPRLGVQAAITELLGKDTNEVI